MEVEIVEKKKTSFIDKIRKSPLVVKLKKIKNIEFILCLFIIAIALLLYSGLTKQSKTDTPVSSVTSASQSSDEARLSEILSAIDGAGEVNVMITQMDGKISGVLVVASGAKDLSIRLKLLEATKVALNVNADIVSVYASNKV
ncbi:MAG: hypothetical protein MRZ86_03960 [Acidaminococcus sp.]|nr:hypothetical protein [Acidaminococcus sp.]MDD7398930.1 hypothetical protein [Bacillota bacterium]MDY4559229.1 hypothetical protein [Eubacteriales bacterium]MDY5345080.1 hypothetical protein [Eubacteriales bacterium]